PILLVSFLLYMSFLRCDLRSSLFPYTPFFRSDRRGRCLPGEHLMPLLDFLMDHTYRMVFLGTSVIGLVAGALGSFAPATRPITEDRKSTRLNSSHASNSYAVFCL